MLTRWFFNLGDGMLIDASADGLDVHVQLSHVTRYTSSAHPRKAEDLEEEVKVMIVSLPYVFVIWIHLALLLFYSLWCFLIRSPVLRLLTFYADSLWIL